MKNIVKGMIVCLGILIMIPFFQYYSFKTYDIKSDSPKEVINNNSYSYDSNGNVVRIEYLDSYKQLGYFAIQKSYNALNQCIKQTFLDVDGKITSISNGYAIVHYEYDDSGKLSYVYYCDPSDKPCLNNERINGITYSYTENSVTSTFVDFDKKPIEDESGCGYVVRTYQDNVLVQVNFYTLSNEPYYESSEYCGYSLSYDTYGRKDTQTFFTDIENYVVKYSYYSDGSIKAEMYYKEDGSSYKYNNKYNGIYYREDGKKVYLNDSCRQLLIIDRYLTEYPITVIEGVLLWILLFIMVPKPYKAYFILIYIVCIFYFTLYGRVVMDRAPKLELFWSYKELFTKGTLSKEVVFNILLFVPLGSMLTIYKKRIVYCFPFLLSVCIEVTQLCTGLGYFEYDDIFGNTLGSIIGIVCSTGIERILNYVKNKKI